MNKIEIDYSRLQEIDGVWNDEFNYKGIIMSWELRKELSIENITFENWKKLVDKIKS